MQILKQLTATVFFTLILFSAKAQNTSVSWISSVEGNVWHQQANIDLQDYTSGTVDIEINPLMIRQTFKSWGTCFNQLGWDALNMTSVSDHDNIMEKLFAPDGDMGFTFCRIPIGANDYARRWYSCNETDQDFAMEHFNIDQDKQTLIPYIREALDKNPNIEFWGSPWSPPTWMKTNKHYANRGSDTNGLSSDLDVPTMTANQFIQEPKYLEAYALYFSKFIEAYKQEGINVTTIMYQNEAYSYSVYPNCTWLPDGTIRFNVEYLSPRIRQDHPDVDIFLGTLNSGDASIYKAILSDPRMANAIDGLGFQWEGRTTMSEIHSQFPNYRIMQTESECGYGSFDWPAATHTFSLITQFLFNYAESYTFWNAILADGGYSTWGWVQNALIRVNSSTGAVTYTPEYYAVKHFTNVVKPGSVVLETNQNVDGNLLAVRTPDGKIAVVLGNLTDNTVTRSIKISNKTFSVSLAPQSFNTFVLEVSAEGLLDDSALSASIAEAQTLYDDGSGINAEQLMQAITNAQTAIANAAYQNEIDSALTDLDQAIMRYNLDNMNAGDTVNMTSLIKNPNFNDGITGWTGTGSGGNFVTNDATEFWHTNSTLYQNIDLKPGNYILKARASVDGGDQSYLFAGEDEVKLPAKLASDASNNLTQAAASLKSNEEYQATLEFTLIKSGNIKIGINSKADYLWTVFDSFELYYLGEDIADYNIILDDLITQGNNSYTPSGNESEALLLAINNAQSVEQTSTAIINAIESLQVAITNYNLANVSAEEPVNMTSKIMNPSFEDGLTYWEDTGMVTANNDAFRTKENVVLKDGNNFVEKWVNTGGTVNTPLGISQTISDLPVGTYKVYVAALSLYRNLANMPGGDAPRNGGYIFANDSLVPVNWISEYALTTYVLDGKLTLGYKVESPADGLNWVACDNFRLEYIGVDSTALRNLLSEKIANSESLLGEKMNAEIAGNLEEAISNAEATVNEIPFNGATLKNSALQLSNCVNNAESSILAYKTIKSALDETYSNMVNYIDYPGYNDFNNLYIEANLKFGDGAYSDVEIPAVIEGLSQAEKTCKLTQTAPFDATFLINNPDFEYSTFNVAPKVNIPDYWNLEYHLPSDKDVRLDDKTPYNGLKEFNIWGDYVGQIDLYQDIFLPKGEYTLKAAMRTLDGSAYNLLTNQHIYARVGENEAINSESLSSNGVEVTNGNTWEILSVRFSIPEGGSDVRIGAASEGSGSYDWGGWFQIDDVSLNMDNDNTTTGIEQYADGNDQVVKIEYYDLLGRKITNPQTQRIYVVRKTFESGKIEMEKVLINYR